MDTQEASIYTAVVISSIIISIIITYFVISIVRQQRKNVELIRKNLLTEISTMERERSRIAIDLHDDVGPILSVIKFQIESVSVNDGDDKLQLQNASNHIDSLIHHMREISNNLMPTILLRKGLVASIEEFVNSIESTSKIKVDFKYNNVSEIPQDVSINVYRIINEVFHNTVKHSKASEVSLDISENKNGLSIYYYDNGTGFDFETTINKSSGFGLRNLKSRAEVMNGTMTAESKPGKGTAFLFQIPIK